MKKILGRILICAVLAVSAVSLVSLSSTLAATGDVEGEIFDNLDPSAQVFGQDTADPDQATTVLAEGVAQIIQVALSLLGVLLIVLILYAGFLWMTAAGSEEKISKAKKIIGAAIIGLAIILSAYLITAFVISQLIDATGAGTS